MPMLKKFVVMRETVVTTLGGKMTIIETLFGDLE